MDRRRGRRALLRLSCRAFVAACRRLADPPIRRSRRRLAYGRKDVSANLAWTRLDRFHRVGIGRPAGLGRRRHDRGTPRTPAVRRGRPPAPGGVVDGPGARHWRAGRHPAVAAGAAALGRPADAGLQHRQYRAVAGGAGAVAGGARHRRAPRDTGAVAGLAAADRAQYLRGPARSAARVARGGQGHRHDAAPASAAGRAAQRDARDPGRRAYQPGDQRRHRAAVVPDRRQQPRRTDLPRHLSEQAVAAAARRRGHRAAGAGARCAVRAGGRFYLRRRGLAA